MSRRNRASADDEVEDEVSSEEDLDLDGCPRKILVVLAKRFGVDESLKGDALKTAIGKEFKKASSSSSPKKKKARAETGGLQCSNAASPS